MKGNVIDMKKEYLDLEFQMLDCLNCDYQTPIIKQWLEHSVLCIEGRLTWIKCEYCNYQTELISVMKRHVTDKHQFNPVSKLLKCGLCGFETIYKFSLKNHIKNIHNIDVMWYPCDNCVHNTK